MIYGTANNLSRGKKGAYILRDTYLSIEATLKQVRRDLSRTRTKNLPFKQCKNLQVDN